MPEAADDRPSTDLALIDIGSSSVHLMHRVIGVDGAATWGEVKFPGFRPIDYIEDDRLNDAGRELLITALDSFVRQTPGHTRVCFATSALRGATNQHEVLAEVVARTGLVVRVLDGADEARFTYLAAADWLGTADRDELLLLDIGGGSLEIARGMGREPSAMRSYSLGSGRMAPLLGRRSPAEAAEDVRQRVRADLGSDVNTFRLGSATAVGTSKTFATLAALTTPTGTTLSRSLLDGWVAQALRLSTDALADQICARLPDLSRERAGQTLAGALVASEAMTLLDIPELRICRVALREGMLQTVFSAWPGAPKVQHSLHHTRPVMTRTEERRVSTRR